MIVLTSHSLLENLLLASPSFTADGNASFAISFRDDCHSPFELYLAVYFSLSRVKVAWNEPILLDQLTPVALGYFTLKESVTAPGIDRNCASASTTVKRKTLISVR